MHHGRSTIGHISIDEIDMLIDAIDDFEKRIISGDFEARIFRNIP